MEFMIVWVEYEYAEEKTQMKLNEKDIRKSFGSTTKNIAVFWDVKACHLASRCRCFNGQQRLRLQIDPE